MVGKHSIGLAPDLAEAIVGGFGRGAELRLLGAGALLPDETLARLGCDADVNIAVPDGSGEVLDYGRSRRLPTVAQRRALVLRDGGCVSPDCDRPPAWTQAPHLVFWTPDGRTDLDDLVLVCLFHHRLVHEGSWRLERLSYEDGEASGASGASEASGVIGWRAVAPDGRELVRRRRRSARPAGQAWWLSGKGGGRGQAGGASAVWQGGRRDLRDDACQMMRAR